jgi:hypothetical protein
MVEAGARYARRMVPKVRPELLQLAQRLLQGLCIDCVSLEPAVEAALLRWHGHGDDCPYKLVQVSRSSMAIYCGQL